MLTDDVSTGGKIVALRKESVDRNCTVCKVCLCQTLSLSARRAWIEITMIMLQALFVQRRSPQGERG